MQNIIVSALKMTNLFLNLNNQEVKIISKNEIIESTGPATCIISKSKTWKPIHLSTLNTLPLNSNDWK